MKAMIMAAGLGTRLRPWTLHHPKALVPVGGVPMLERVICRLRDQGFDYIVVNVYHFADQIKEFLAAHDIGVKIAISDESDLLLDTGGAIANAAPLLSVDQEPFLVHNVDILSDAPLARLMELQPESGRDILLLTSGRESSRKLIFTPENRLCGWHKVGTEEYRPEGFLPQPGDSEEAFSGIYVVSGKALADICRYGREKGERKFPIMDYFMDNAAQIDEAAQPAVRIGRHYLPQLNLIDIGRPETLSKADSLLDGSRVS